MEGNFSLFAHNINTNKHTSTSDDTDRAGACAIIADLKNAGFRSNSVYNLDGSIDVAMTYGSVGSTVGGRFTPAE